MGQIYESFRWHQFCMLLAKSLLFLSRIWILMYKLPWSLSHLCKGSLGGWKRGPRWVSCLDSWSSEVPRHHLQLSWQDHNAYYHSVTLNHLRGITADNIWAASSEHSLWKACIMNKEGDFWVSFSLINI